MGRTVSATAPGPYDIVAQMVATRFCAGGARTAGKFLSIVVTVIASAMVSQDGRLTQAIVVESP